MGVITEFTLAVVHPQSSTNIITSSNTAGIYFYGVSNDVGGNLSGNTVSQSKSYAADIYLSGKSVKNLTSQGNTFSGNVYNGFGMGGTFGGSTTLPVLEYPYVPHSVSVASGASLTVQAGTVFKVVSNDLSNSGTLRLDGTTEAPITITSVKDDTVAGDTNNDGPLTTPAAGNWGSLTLTLGAATLSHVRLRYGGISSPQLDHRGGTADLNNITVSDVGGTAISLSDQADLTNSNVSKARTGVNLKSGAPAVSNCDISATEYGINLNSSNGQVSNNNIVSDKYGIYVFTTSSGGRPSITDNGVTGKSEAGIYVYDYKAILTGITITGNEVSNSNYAVRFVLDQSGYGSNVIGTQSFIGNKYNGYGVSGNIIIDTTLYPLDYPYVISSALHMGAAGNPVGKLTLNPCVVMKFALGGSMTVWGPGGSLDARGTLDQEVTLTSEKDDAVGGDTNGDGDLTSPSPGDWYEVSVWDGASVTLDRTVFSYGNSAIYMVRGTLSLTNSDIGYSKDRGVYLSNLGPSLSTIANTTIHDNRYGVYLGQVSNLQISNCTIIHNNEGVYTLYSGPYLDSNNIVNNGIGLDNLSDPGKPNPILRMNSITGNTTGIYYWPSSDAIDARFNWWGSDTGPAPKGNGDAIVGPVSVYPWVGKEYDDARQFGSAWWTSYAKAVNTVTGDWGHQTVDMSIKESKGLPIEITRSYHSLGWGSGPLGYLWRFNYDEHLNDEPAEMRVTVVYGTGQQARFTANQDGTYSAPAGEPNKLVKMPDGSWVLTTKNHEEHIFNSNGHLETLSDQNGNKTLLGYNGVGQLASITDACGRVVNLTYDTQGRIVSIVGPENTSVSYTYDDQGDLRTFTNPMGKVTTYNYDRDHRLLSIIGPDNVTQVRLEYDSNTRVAKVYDGLNNATSYTYDTANRRTTVTNPRGYQTKYDYDVTLRLLSITDPLNYSVVKTYDDFNNVISAKDKAGGISTYTFDNYNQTSYTNPLGKTTSYTYDTGDNLVLSVDPLLGETAYTYDAHHNVLTQTDPLDRLTQYSYYTNGQLQSVEDPSGNVNSFEYDSYGNIAKVIDPLNNETVSTFDLLGRLTSTTDPLNGKTSMTYDKTGNLLTVCDANNGNTTYTYDDVGRRTTETNAELKTSTMAYDAVGHVVAKTDPLNNTRSYTFDASGNLITETDELNNSIGYEYNARNEVIQTTDALGNKTYYAYDANGNKTSVTDPRNNQVTYEYDLMNRLVKVKDPDQAILERYEYDDLGRKTAKIDGNGRTTNWTFDAAGQVTNETDPLGHVTTSEYDLSGNRTSMTNALNETTQYEYDAAGRLTAVVMPGGERYTYEYDALGRMTGVTDPNSHKTTKVYDNLGRVTMTTEATGDEIQYTYDKLGNCLTMLDQARETTQYQYDANSRLTKVMAPGGLTIEYSYDAAGHRLSISDAAGATSYTYDPAGHLTKVETPDQRFVGYEYDPSGNRSKLTDYGGQITTYNYDKRNRLSSLSAYDGATTSYTYDGNDQWLSVVYPNGTQAATTYDTGNRLVRVDNKLSNGTVISSFEYTYDLMDRWTKVVDSQGTTQYEYDTNDRLQKVTLPDGTTTDYGYDGSGNRQTKTTVQPGGNQELIEYRYDANNRLTQSVRGMTATSYSYDDKGNMLGDGTLSYSYDGLNRLIAVTNGGTAVAEYRYDGDGLRTEKTVGGVKTKYYYDQARVLNEGDGTNITASNVWGLNLVRREDAAQKGYYLYNGHHDVVGITDPQANTIASYYYDEFGRIVANTGSFDNPFRYTGELYDPETNAIYLRARYYQPEPGRFMTQDTWPGDPERPGMQNLYVYAGNNPVNYVDPTGHAVVTLGYGSVTAAGPIGGKADISIALDGHGNMVLLRTMHFTTAGVAVGSSPQLTLWNKDNVYELEGDGVSFFAVLGNGVELEIDPDTNTLVGTGFVFNGPGFEGGAGWSTGKTEIVAFLPTVSFDASINLRDVYRAIFGADADSSISDEGIHQRLTEAGINVQESGVVGSVNRD